VVLFDEKVKDNWQDFKQDDKMGISWWLVVGFWYLLPWTFRCVPHTAD